MTGMEFQIPKNLHDNEHAVLVQVIHQFQTLTCSNFDTSINTHMQSFEHKRRDDYRFYSYQRRLWYYNMLLYRPRRALSCPT